MKMKKILSSIIVFLLLGFGTSMAQEDSTAETGNDTAAVAEQPEEAAPAEEAVATTVIEEDDGVQENLTAHQVLKKYFIEGGPGFMGIVLVCLILGLAFAIERIITLNLSTVNQQQFLGDIDKSLGSGGTDAAKELCKSTRGPIASIFFQGLDRAGEGIDVVEKSIVAYGSVEMGRIEKGLIWISLFIALAPMLGFMGTVIGMVEAFDSIEIAGDISPSLVAGGIKVALLTTLFGLIVAVILQVFYNYIISKIDSLVNNMEDASISLVDLLIKHKITK